ncbi:aspartic peptidase domain-containing protein [Xylariales sp. PMI_506]|nr:aspartic peptidase domain-containing protein [Xylariales sp. PMI_506]
MEPIFAAQNSLRQSLGLRRVTAVRNKNYKAHGTKSYVYLLNRFGFQPTQPGPYVYVKRTPQHHGFSAKARKAVGARVHTDRVLAKKSSADGEPTGEVGAEDQQNDSLYTCEVNIGTPAQTLMLDFDTGSADLWVNSTEESSTLQKNHKVFDPKKSSTYKALTGLTWKISYGDGSSASGDCGSDVVSIGGLSIQNQTVELAKTMSSAFSDGTSDGLLGLAFSSINTVEKNGKADPQKSPVDNMIAQDDIPQTSELFTAAFYSERDNTDSFYTFGYIDQDLVNGQTIHWTPVDNSQGFWMFPSQSFSVNGTSTTQSGNTAIADTGTTLALVSDAACKALYAQIKGAKYDNNQQGWVFPDTVQASDLPEFKVDVGGLEFVIQAEDLAFASTGDGYWYGGVQSRGDNPFDILGDIFLKSVYAIFDQGNQRFGAVPKLQSTQDLQVPASSASQ